MTENTGFNLTPAQFVSLAPKTRKRLLHFFLRWNRYEQALPLARYLAEDQPDGLVYRASLAQVLTALKQLDEAQCIVDDLRDQHPMSQITLAAAGDIEMAREELPAALKCYLQMLQVNEQSPKAWRRLVALYFAAGKLDTAHAYCRKVIDYYESRHKKPDEDTRPQPDILRILSLIHRQNGDNSLADQIDAELREWESRDEREMLDLINQPQPPSSQRKQKMARHTQQAHPVVRTKPPAPPLPAEALSCLKQTFGHDGFRKGQEEVIVRALSGQDQLVVMPTGFGKSLCYQLPAAMGRKVVVISPLIALMKDQLDGLPPVLAARSTLINSTLDSDELERRQNDIAAGRYNLIYAAPERLRQVPFLHALKSAEIDLFVVDEVHCVSIWGHDFRPDYLFISSALKALDGPTFCGMTATAGPSMRLEIEARVGRELVFTSIGTYRPNLTLEVKKPEKTQGKLREVSRICHSERGSGIIYANSRRQTEEIAAYLRAEGIAAGHYHAGMEPTERAEMQEAFMSGRCRVMAATVAFGMGVDKRDVRFVVHFSLPKSLENYYQEAGRAGRDGLPSRCVLFYTPADKARLSSWVTQGETKMDNLKSVYEAIRKAVPSRSGPVHEEDIIRESQMDETSVRVAISLFERVGLLRRGPDVPMTLNIMLKASDAADPEFTRFAAAARLRPRQKITLGLTDLCELTRMSAADIEPRLLDWQDQGYLTYRGSGRTMFIEMCRAEKGARAVMEKMLLDHHVESQRKVEILADYAKSSACRHDYIARHFGDPGITGCQFCDNCLASAAPRKMTDEHIRILQGVRDLPIRQGKKALVKALTGSPGCPIQPHEWRFIGCLSTRTPDAVARMIDDLTAWGYLEPDGNLLRSMIVLTNAGRALLRESEDTSDEPAHSGVMCD